MGRNKTSGGVRPAPVALGNASNFHIFGVNLFEDEFRKRKDEKSYVFFVCAS